jgi:hypothetical protein
MKFFRYRRPSLKTLLGVTKAKKRVKKELDGDEVGYLVARVAEIKRQK